MAIRSKVTVFANITLEYDDNSGQPIIEVCTPCGKYLVTTDTGQLHVPIGEYLLSAKYESGAMDVFTREPNAPPDNYVRVLISNVLITDDPGIALIASVRAETAQTLTTLPVITADSLSSSPLPQSSSASILPTTVPFQFAFANLIGFSAQRPDTPEETWTTSIYPAGWQPYYGSRHVAIQIMEVTHEQVQD
jgi:hypothetical protein